MAPQQQAGPAPGKSACDPPECCASCDRLRRDLQETRRALQDSQAREAKLAAQLSELRRTLFGHKSEAAPPGEHDPSPEDPPGEDALGGNPPEDGPEAGGQQEQEPGQQADGEERKKRGRQPGAPTPPREKRPDVPQVSERLDVPEQDRCCPACGTAYVPNGSKLSWLYEIDWQAVARKLRRQRYKPACDCPEAHPVIAKPAARLGSSQLGGSVWAWLLTQVFALYRPQAAVARDVALLAGMRVPYSTLSEGLRRHSHLFAPLDAAIAQRQQQAAVAQADETSWPVQYIEDPDDNKDPPPRGRQKQKYWLWVCLTQDTVRMRILATRGLASGAQLLAVLVLGDNGPVILMCDRYSAYKAFAKLYPGKVLPAYCWVHVRRDYRKIGTGHLQLQAWSEAWIERIGWLFHLNRLRLRAWQAGLPLERQSAEFNGLQRQLQAAVDDLFRTAQQEGLELGAEWTRLNAERNRHGAELARLDAQGRALASLLKHREGLSRFVSDPRIPLENNASERALRGPVIARHTSFGSGGPDGARAAGLLFGVLQTVRMAGLNPYAWMLDWLRACARNGGRAPQNLDPWLPWRMSEQRQQALRKPPANWQPDASGLSCDQDAEAGAAVPKAA